MKTRLTIVFFIIFAVVPALWSQTPSWVPPLYAELPPGSVQPNGWLLSQLEIMRDGTSGHLDEVYPKVSNSNGWLGGTGDGWEETPYWLDGAVPLAYLLNDAVLKAKVQRYIDWTLEHQRPTGYFGPITKAERDGKILAAENFTDGEDWWPKMVMLKVMQQAYQATGDKRIIPFMQKYFAYQLAVLKSCPLGQWTEWAVSRGSENILIVQWLYGITHDPSLLELASLLESQSFPWSLWLGNRDWVIHAAAYQDETNWMHRHGVNVGMALKSPALNYQRTGDKKFLLDQKTGINDLLTLHGLPMGIFSADEDLHGNNPEQGTELCALVEAMYSLEQSIAITGDVPYMDALEKMTFNALPTQTTDDYNAKQYFQIANQVQVKRGVFTFSLPFSRQMTNVFGMRSGYTCCLANMHQGWTKFATHLWFRSHDGLAAFEYAPCTLTIRLADREVIVREDTEYPFDDRISFTFTTDKPAAFPLQLRIPTWCRDAVLELNGTETSHEPGGKIVTLSRTWKSGDKLVLHLPMDIRITQWGRNSRAIERGPLVYALKLGERWEKATEPTEGDYWSVYPTGPWNYGLPQEVVKDPASRIEVRKGAAITADFVWNAAHAPVELVTSGKRIPEWKILNDVAPIPQTDRHGLFKGEVSDTVETITLIPYGFSKVRIVAFPVVP
jgi:hypothetical protein